MTSSSDSAAWPQRRDRGGISVRDIRAAAILLFATLALNPVVLAQNVVATIYPATAQKSVFAVAINAVTNRAYVVNSGSASVTVIDGQTDAASPASPTGQTPVATWLSWLGAAGLMSACLARFGRRERPTRPCARIHGPCARLPSSGMRIGWIRAALCLGMLLVCVSGTALLTGCGGGHPGVGGLAQTTQLTLVVQ